MLNWQRVPAWVPARVPDFRLQYMSTYMYAPVLGGLEVVRARARCVEQKQHTYCAWGSGVCARVVLNSSSSTLLQ